MRLRTARRRGRHAARDRRRDPPRGGRAHDRRAGARPHAWSAPASCRNSSSPAPPNACACACRWKARCRRRPTVRARTAAAGCSTRSRTFPEQRANPLAVGQKVDGQRAPHPQPADADLELHGHRARGRPQPMRCSDTPLLADARHAHADPHHHAHDAHGERAARHAGARPPAPAPARRRCGTLRTAPRRSWCCRLGAPLPTRIVVLPGAEARRRLARRRGEPLAPHPRRVGPARHPRGLDARARARLAPAHPARLALAAPRPSMASTCAPSCASAIPTRSSHANSPSTRNSMLVFGVDSLDDDESARLKSLLEGALVRAGPDRPRPGRDGLSLAAGRIAVPSPLPGFGLTFGFTTFFLSAVILLPLAAMVIRALGIPPVGPSRDPDSTSGRSPPTACPSAPPRSRPASTRCSASSSPGRWCATTSRAGGCST